MAGLGGAVGYLFGSVDWNSLPLPFSGGGRNAGRPSGSYIGHSGGAKEIPAASFTSESAAFTAEEDMMPKETTIGSQVGHIKRL